jgi:hypothetical protein
MRAHAAQVGLPVADMFLGESLQSATQYLQSAVESHGVGRLSDFIWQAVMRHGYRAFASLVTLTQKSSSGR